MKKKLALLLTTVATVATVFTGCGSKDVSGDYTAEMKLVEFMDESDVEDMKELGIDMSTLTVDLDLTLTEDETFTLAFNTEDFKKQYKDLMDKSMDTIIDQSLAASGLSRDDITDEAAVMMGYESKEALFQDLKNEIMSSMDTELEYLDSSIDQYTTKGKYTVTKDTITFVVNDDTDDLALDVATITDDDNIELDVEMDEDETITLVFEKAEQ
ncbi:MAG: hypothetical protein K6B67_03825 [Lachnospiraceae bacterium]|nr:hypothetical protein [Lachnospiraceae bacterium]